MPYILQTFTTSRGLEGLAVDDCVHCGICRPKPEPVSLDFLDPQ